MASEFGMRFELEDRVAVEHFRVGKIDAGWPARPGACRNEKVVGLEQAVAGAHVPPVDKRRASVNELDAVAPEIGENLPRLEVAYRGEPASKVARRAGATGEMFANAVVDFASLESGQIERAFPKRLRGQCPGVNSRPARSAGRRLDERDALAKEGRGDRGLLASRPAADDHEVVDMSSQNRLVQSRAETCTPTADSVENRPDPILGHSGHDSGLSHARASFTPRPDVAITSRRIRP